MKWTVILIALVYYAETVKVDDTRTSTTPPAVDKRFFDFGGILGHIFHGHNHDHHQPSVGFGGNSYPSQYPVQQNPQFENSWQSDRGPQLFPSQEQDSSISGQGPSQSNFNQGSFNQGNNFGPGLNQNINTGTLDDIPPQNGGQMQNLNRGNQGFPSQNGQGFQTINGGNQGFPTSNWGNQGFQTSNGGNQGFQTPNGWNQGFQGNGGYPGFQNQNGQGNMYNPAAILGSPVPVPSTPVPDRIIFQDRSDTPAEIQCVQDCATTTEYSPVCGSNNITYFNPGRFVCARNCGINVFLDHPGRCFN